MLLTPEKITAAGVGFRAIYLQAYEGATPDWLDIAMEVESNSESETYNFLTGLPGMKRLIGEAKPEDFAIAGMTIKNEEWESTVYVKRMVIERDSLGLVRPQMSELGTIAREHPGELVADLLNGGFATKDYTTKNFFDTAKKHDPSDKSNGARVFTNKGTAALSAASFVVARTALRKMTDAKGKNLKLGRKLVLIVPPALEETANKLATSELVPNAAGTASETNTLKGTFTVKVMNDLTSDTAWFLVESARQIKPLIVQFEVRPEFIIADDPKGPLALLQKKFAYQAYGRWNAGYGLPQFAYGSTGAG